MALDPKAGKPATPDMLVDVPRLITAYYALQPDPDAPEQLVSFGTSGHRGTSLKNNFNENHILAITEAICRYRKQEQIDGPLYLAKDTHALSEPAFASALEVLAAHDVTVCVDCDLAYTPTPALSHAILTWNRGRESGLADGIVITPSHNPPEDGGFKYNPPSGGPADTGVTKWIQDEANRLLAAGLSGVKRTTYQKALKAGGTQRFDYLSHYVNDLCHVIDMDSIRGARLNLAVDPLGGAGVFYWPRIAEHYKFPLTVLNSTVDPTFRFMTADWDGRIRMDCSSPYAMASVIALKDRFDVAFACDTDHDRHGVVTRSSGLLNPNHYLAVAISYLYRNRSSWRADSGVGKTVVSSSMIDRVAAGLGRRLDEVPVGFKWFVPGLLDGSVAFGGEESAGASFLRSNGEVWSTDKDGIIMGLLSAEIMARQGRDPGELYSELTARYGNPVYERIDAPATPEIKKKLAGASPDDLRSNDLAGEKIEKVLTTAPGNGAAIGGMKVMSANGWFAARPSGTENVYKVYAESFLGEAHLRRIQQDAQALISSL
ncbi:MAG TPA: phosphoglucomutase (alpha-D-glucose-1,6-bisphosphate-dependent) [Bryobacteraceae bacterium]|nr:phosphoglucomutase (alpha-D-glucose-1,6-bisphosphate-dependent) [Bryobacteraceae bacterium]